MLSIVSPKIPSFVSPNMPSFVSSLLALSMLTTLLVIAIPLAGALVRFRAHYSPKGLQLDPEGGVQPYAGPVITSFIAMLMRVHKIEGQPGLYKGSMPTLLLTFITALLLWLFPTNSYLRHWTHRIPLRNLSRTLVYSIFDILILLPHRIISIRAITTPHKLPYFNVIYSLRILLTPTERRRPWILYLTPGLLAAQVCQIVYDVLWRTAQHLLLPELAWRGIYFSDISAINMAKFFVLALADAVVLAPLEVIATRLVIQRNHASPECNSVSQEEEGDAEEATEYVGIDEDVIGLRTDQEPYVGLIDCAKRIIDEEGWTVLYRAWWLIVLGKLGSRYARWLTVVLFRRYSERDGME